MDNIELKGLFDYLCSNYGDSWKYVYAGFGDGMTLDVGEAMTLEEFFDKNDGWKIINKPTKVEKLIKKNIYSWISMIKKFIWVKTYWKKLEDKKNNKQPDNAAFLCLLNDNSFGYFEAVSGCGFNGCVADGCYCIFNYSTLIEKIVMCSMNENTRNQFRKDVLHNKYLSKLIHPNHPAFKGDETFQNYE